MQILLIGLILATSPVDRYNKKVVKDGNDLCRVSGCGNDLWPAECGYFKYAEKYVLNDIRRVVEYEPSECEQKFLRYSEGLKKVQEDQEIRKKYSK